MGFFNHNRLLKCLPLLSKDTRELVKHEKEHPLEELYTSFPKNIQRDYREIYQFLTRETLHELHFEITKDINDKERKVEIIERYGTDLSSEDGRFQSTLKNLINFILKNGIYVDNYSLYRDICQNYVKISFLQQYDKQAITLGKTELYVCIKYFSSEDLQHLFKDVWKPSKRKLFKLDETLLKWLVDDVLENCTNYFICEDRSILYTHFDRYIENILFLLAQNELSDKQLDQICDILKKLVNEAHNTIPIFKAINTFVAIQWNLHKKSFKGNQVIVLLENLLTKFAFRKTNGHEEWALSLNQISNLYYSCQILQSKFTSETIISQVIHNIDNFNQREKINYLQNVLLELYQISDKKCQKAIKRYAIKQKFITSDKFDSFLDVVNYHLHLAALGIEDDKISLCQMVEKMLQEYPEKVYYHSIQSTQHLLEFLQKKDPDYSTLYRKVKLKVHTLDKEFGHVKPLKRNKS